MKKILSLSAVCAVMTGCAFTPQAVSINPKVEVASSLAGNNKPLSLNVIDERPRKTLGTVAPGNRGADISLEGDLAQSVHKALNDGLSRMSFKPASDKDGKKSELRVEVRNLDYTVIQGFWAGTLRVDAGLKGICIRDGLRPYEKVYNGEFVESVQVVQPKEANAQYINSAVSTAVNALLSDTQLISCIAG